MMDDRPSANELTEPVSGSRYPVWESLVGRLEAYGDWAKELSRWYESDWQHAIQSGQRPVPERVLQSLTPERQIIALEFFRSIDDHYESRLRRPSRPTLEQQLDETVAAPLSASQTPSQPIEVTDFSANQSLIEQPTVSLATGVVDTHDPDTLDMSHGEVVGTARPQSVTVRSNPKHTKASKGLPVIPGYRIDGVLGRGGMGVVYAAHQLGIERPVALKMILSGVHASRSVMERFLAEARAVGKLRHENIVQIYDIGSNDDLPYFSLEYVDGSSLYEKIKGEPMDPIEAARLIAPLAQALHFAHDAGIIHRDLKPGNILVNSSGIPKLCDFGLAKEIEGDSDLSRTGDVVGTPSYMAPEQARGSRDITASADIYGMGGVLYCALTGRPPFTSTKAIDTVIQVLGQEPVPPTRLQPSVPKDLETICLKCLQKDPASRYATAGDLADDLNRFVRGEPISARPVSRIERAWRWSRRNPLIASISAIAASLALVILVGGPISAAVIYSQKKEVVAANVIAQQNAETAQENEQLAVAAKIVADKNAEAASVQEKNAVDTIKSLTFVVQEKMSGRADLLEMRQALLQTVRNGVERLEKTENNASQRNMITAGIHSRLGEINMELGQPGKAYQEYSKCLSIFHDLEKENALPFASTNMAKIHQYLGDSARQEGSYQKAHEHFAKSLEIRRQSLKESNDQKLKVEVATSLGKLGSLAQTRGDLEIARTYMEEALALREELYKQNRRDGRARSEVQGAKLVLAKIRFQQGEKDVGLNLLSEAAANMRELGKLNPKSNSTQQNVAMFDADLGVLQLYVGQFDAAKENFARAVTVLERLHSEEPNDLRAHQELSDALYGLSVTQRRLGNDDQAKTLIKRAVDLRREAVSWDSTNVTTKLGLVAVLARAGEVAEGITLADNLAKEIKTDSTKHYDLACGYALLAEVRQFVADQKLADDLPTVEDLRNRSVAALKQALDAGFLRASDLQLDPDLDSVRETSEYQSLVDETLATHSRARES